MEPRTSIAVESRGFRNVWVVEIVGRHGGHARLYRRSYEDALATARRFAQLLDSPRQVI